MENALTELFVSFAGCRPPAMEPLGVSGSNRKYYRIYSSGKTSECSCKGTEAADTYIGVIGTDARENRTFCALARHFASKGINVPEVYAISEDGLCYIQQDLGKLSLYDAVACGRQAAVSAFKPGFAEECTECLSAGRFNPVSGSLMAELKPDYPECCAATDEPYSEAERALLLKTVSMLPEIQMEGAQGLDFSVCHPHSSLDARSIMFDLNYFKYCFLKLTGIEFNAVLLEDDFEKLCADILSAGEKGFMYRDFQSRNVMLRDGEPYFIDFQGGMCGPVYYDLASFVWQAKACYPDGLRNDMVAVYIESMRRYMPVDEDAFHARLNLFVLFRTLQVLGAYGFRGLFERKQHFMDSIPFALKNLLSVLDGFVDAYPYLCGVLRKMATVSAVAGNVLNADVPHGNVRIEETEQALEHAVSETAIAADKEMECQLSGVEGVMRIEKVEPEVAHVSKAGNGTVGNVEWEQTVGAENTGCATSANVMGDEAKCLEIEIYSFSYKRGIPEDRSGNGGGYVFDCRSIHNPGRYDEYKKSTGMDADVVKFLEDDGEISRYLEHVYGVVDPHVDTFLRRGFTHLMASFGCTGGQHRSVYCAEHLAEHLKERYATQIEDGRMRILLIHREQDVRKCFSSANADHNGQPTAAWL
ncbi:MAG: phosphotransferase [Bacteroidales bacterium]|nr:phosphotransferase [Bacteroidales bacterium]